MARKPVHLTALGPRQDRQAQWEAMRKLRSFSAAELRGELHGYTPLATIRSYCAGLTAAGYLKKRGPRYALVKDCGVEAPRVRADGSAVTQGRGREQLWRTLKMLGDFSARDLAIHASTEAHPIAEGEAKDYIGWLYKAGYLQRTADANTHGGQARYRLIPSRYSGPRPPQIQRVQQVFDPNTGRVVYQQGGRHD